MASLSCEDKKDGKDEQHTNAGFSGPNRKPGRCHPVGALSFVGGRVRGPGLGDYRPWHPCRFRRGRGRLQPGRDSPRLADLSLVFHKGRGISRPRPHYRALQKREAFSRSPPIFWMCSGRSGSSTTPLTTAGRGMRPWGVWGRGLCLPAICLPGSARCAPLRPTWASGQSGAATRTRSCRAATTRL
jgi:hypothetical protein